MRGPLVVVGDALLDIDLEGSAERLTPDAPVPVLDDLRESPRPGGAALAATMAARDGHEVVLLTAVGEDGAGERLCHLVSERRVQLCRLPYDGPTPVKRRVRAGGQSLLRLDSGSAPGRVGEPPDGVATVLHEAGAVLVADYGRGVTRSEAVRRVLARRTRGVPRVWDPHQCGSLPLPGSTLVTPNEREAAGFAGTGGTEGGRLARTGRHADTLVARWGVHAVAVTLGERGALLSFGHGTPVVVPAPPATAMDPCGAGDRFAVSAALALGGGRVTSEAVQDAVREAAAYVAAGGPASLVDMPGRREPTDGRSLHRTLGAVRARGGTVVATGGCFDLLHAGHVATLRAARRLGDCLVVCLNSDDSVRRLKGAGRPLVPAADRVRVLEALECVDAVVVFDEDTPVRVLHDLRPDVWAKGGDYAGVDVPEAAVLRSWGGQVVALPYLEGRSTTRLVESAAVNVVPESNTQEEESR